MAAKRLVVAGGSGFLGLLYASASLLEIIANLTI
jgi:hypothetical protein